MRLKNRFKEEDKIRVWVDHQYCGLCKSNQRCSLHHIDGTVSSSIYNSIMLCDNCHRRADAHNTPSKASEDFRHILRRYTFNLVERTGRPRQQNDDNYLALYKTRTY